MPTATASDQTMGRKKRSPDESPPTVTVKLDRILASRAKFIASDMGIDTAQYLADLLRAPIDRDWAKIRERMEGE